MPLQPPCGVGLPPGAPPLLPVGVSDRWALSVGSVALCAVALARCTIKRMWSPSSIASTTASLHWSSVPPFRSAPSGMTSSTQATRPLSLVFFMSRSVTQAPFLWPTSAAALAAAVILCRGLGMIGEKCRRRPASAELAAAEAAAAMPAAASPAIAVLAGVAVLSAADELAAGMLATAVPTVAVLAAAAVLIPTAVLAAAALTAAVPAAVAALAAAASLATVAVLTAAMLAAAVLAAAALTAVVPAASVVLAASAEPAAGMLTAVVLAAASLAVAAVPTAAAVLAAVMSAAAMLSAAGVLAVAAVTAAPVLLLAADRSAVAAIGPPFPVPGSPSAVGWPFLSMLSLACELGVLSLSTHMLSARSDCDHCSSSCR